MEFERKLYKAGSNANIFLRKVLMGEMGEEYLKKPAANSRGYHHSESN